MDSIGFIFARSGSKGLPQKNTLDFCGKPLISWTLELALSLQRFRRIIVSTDDPKIIEISQDLGVEVPFVRPAHLATDQSPERLSWRHALNFIKGEEGKLPDAMVILPVTAPLRLGEDVTKCMDLFETGGVDTIITYKDAARSPYFNMVELTSDSLLKLPMVPTSKVSRRQDAPVIFDMTTVAYVSDPSTVLATESIFDGRVKGVFIPQERAIDIDTKFDFEVAEYLMKRRLDSIG